MGVRLEPRQVWVRFLSLAVKHALIYRVYSEDELFPSNYRTLKMPHPHFDS